MIPELPKPCGDINKNILAIDSKKHGKHGYDITSVDRFRQHSINK